VAQLPDLPPDELLTVSTAEQYKALSHPMRHRLLFALGQAPATISQLSSALDTRKGNVAHHLGVLRDAGLVRVVATRQVRGGTEQYYQRAARRIGFTDADAQVAGPIAVHAVAEEIASAAPDPVLLLRNIRLTAAQVERLSAAFTELVDGLEDAGPDEPRHGVLVTLYRPRELT
jgi:DNA-binding transcriptional ArsR family regulator